MINPNKKLTTNLTQILLFLIYLTYTLPTSVSSSLFFFKKNSSSSFDTNKIYMEDETYTEGESNVAMQTYRTLHKLFLKFERICTSISSYFLFWFF